MGWDVHGRTREQVNQRRKQASDNVKELFNLSQGGKQGESAMPCHAAVP
jgi:hypothetical protein